MTNYSEIAVKYFKDGYNCAQSTLLAFAPVIGFDKDTCLKLASSFGGGMGRLREVCGAVSAMFMIAGLKKGYLSPSDDEQKGAHYQLIQDLAEEFKSQAGSYICRDILGLENEKDVPTPSKRTEEYYEERPCENCIKIACKIIEKNLL